MRDAYQFEQEILPLLERDPHARDEHFQELLREKERYDAEELDDIDLDLRLQRFQGAKRQAGWLLQTGHRHCIQGIEPTHVFNPGDHKARYDAMLKAGTTPEAVNKLIASHMRRAITTRHDFYLAKIHQTLDSQGVAVLTIGDAHCRFSGQEKVLHEVFDGIYLEDCFYRNLRDTKFIVLEPHIVPSEI